LFSQKYIYKSQALAVGVAHSVTGAYEMKKLIKLALALALELNNGLATALELLNKNCLRLNYEYVGVRA
jgi:hypothetical protein